MSTQGESSGGRGAGTTGATSKNAGKGSAQQVAASQSSVTQVNSARSDAARPMIVNEVLYFLLNKIGRFSVQQLKTVIFEFYTALQISSAKIVLFDVIVDMKRNIPLRMALNRRESKENPDLKIKQDIDDLMALVQIVDEHQIQDYIPLFLIANPDMIPSPRIVEGDLSVLVHKMT